MHAAMCGKHNSLLPPPPTDGFRLQGQDAEDATLTPAPVHALELISVDCGPSDCPVDEKLELSMEFALDRPLRGAWWSVKVCVCVVVFVVVFVPLFVCEMVFLLLLSQMLLVVVVRMLLLLFSLFCFF